MSTCGRLLLPGPNAGRLRGSDDYSLSQWAHVGTLIGWDSGWMQIWLESIGILYKQYTLLFLSDCDKGWLQVKICHLQRSSYYRPLLRVMWIYGRNSIVTTDSGGEEGWWIVEHERQATQVNNWKHFHSPKYAVTEERSSGRGAWLLWDKLVKKRY